MSLSPGTRLGPYEVTALIDAVARARCTLVLSIADDVPRFVEG